MPTTGTFYKIYRLWYGIPRIPNYCKDSAYLNKYTKISYYKILLR